MHHSGRKRLHNQKNRCHPVKSESRKNTSPIKKISFFRLARTYSPPRHRFITFFHTHYFFFIGSRTAYTDPHQPAKAELPSEDWPPSEPEAHQVQGDCVLGKILCYNPLFTSLICSFTSYVFNPQISQITQITLIT